MSSEDTLDLPQAAKFLCASARKTQELAAAGAIPGAKIGKRWIFRRVDLEAYLAASIERQTEARRTRGAAAPTPGRPYRGRRTPLATLPE